MYRTILKLLSPYIQKWIANRVIAYLQTRREQQAVDSDIIEQPAPDVPAPQPPVISPAPPQKSKTLLLTLSGIVFGSLLGFILSQLRQRNQ